MTKNNHATTPLLDAENHAQDQMQTLTNTEVGLTSAQVQQRLKAFGPNQLNQTKLPTWKKFLKHFWGPMPWLIEAAVIVSAALQDWKDLAFLSALLIINGIVAFTEEHKAGNAIEALKKSLAPKARVLRDGKWDVITARELVPDDVILLRLGDVVPADAVLGPGEPMEVDQSALTGESLPVQKVEGEAVFQGSAIKRGELQALVTHTGANTFFGKAAALVDSVNRPGNFQLILFRVAKMLIALASLLVTIIFFVLIFDDERRQASCATEGCRVAAAVKLCLVLLVASIPIAMQVVCTTTMAVGSRALAAKDAVVARLSAIEELAGMTILCSDKTGTLTKNQLTLGEPTVLSEDVTADELIYMAGLSCKHDGEQEPIDRAICESPSVTNAATPISEYEVLRFVPFDPIRKRTEATLRAPDGSVFSVSKGSPQVINELITNQVVRERVRQVVDEYATRGYRTLGVARSKKGKGSGSETTWEYLGVLSLYDPPRDDTAATCAAAMTLGNEVKMITGDHIAIAKETARQLGLGTSIVRPDIFAHSEQLGDGFISRYGDFIEGADGFAEVMPEHKFAIVDVLQRRDHIVGMTGDGVNDAPALKQADIGIAVQGATDAARAAADIVLMTPGLSVIIDAIVLSRGIFQRMKNYCTYRIACTTQILFFFFISIIWQGFQIPVFVICLISILNDGTIMSIAYDRVQPSRNPEAWDLPQTVGISATIGLVGVCATFLLLFLAQCDTSPGGQCSHFFTTLFNGHLFPHQLAEAQVQALIYLQLSIGGQATIFAARTRSFFFMQRPGTALMIAFVVAQTVSTFVVIYSGGNLSPMIGLGMNCDVQAQGGVKAVNDCFLSANQTTPQGQPCASLCVSEPGNGWKFAAFTWIYCFVWLLVQDALKIAAITTFDMHDPERAEKRRLKIENKMLMGRHSQMQGPSGCSTRRTTLQSTAAGGGGEVPGADRATVDDPHNVLEPVVEWPSIGNLPVELARLRHRVNELESELRRRPQAGVRSHHAILTGDSGDSGEVEAPDRRTL